MNTNTAKANEATIESVLHDYLAESNINDDEILVELIKRVEHVRQIENIAGVRGMSIRNTPDEDDIYQTYCDDIEIYNN